MLFLRTCGSTLKSILLNFLLVCTKILLVLLISSCEYQVDVISKWLECLDIVEKVLVDKDDHASHNTARLPLLSMCCTWSHCSVTKLTDQYDNFPSHNRLQPSIKLLKVGSSSNEVRTAENLPMIIRKAVKIFFIGLEVLTTSRSSSVLRELTMQNRNYVASWQTL